MKPMKLVIAATLALSLGACANNGYGDKQTAGALIGAGVGGLLGSTIGGGSGRLAATAAGTVLGLALGADIGRSLDRADRLYAGRSQQQALETLPVGQSAEWSNPDSGNRGSITPTRTYQVADGRYCREFQHAVTVGGKSEMAYGNACRQPDGSWRIVN
ncbi:MAG: RT0821/Lpp0805 family surface protein [Alphaproteobacteria bacterium]